MKTQGGLLCSVVLLCTAHAASVEGVDSTEALHVVERFYEALTAHGDGSNPHLFTQESLRVFVQSLPGWHGKLSLEDSLRLVWQYLRKNKSQFCFSQVSAEQAFDYANKAYLFMNPRTDDPTTGTLAIMLRAPLKGTGIHKEVTFTLLREGGEYHIVLHVVRVNGFLMDPSNELPRVKDIYDVLGWQRSNPEARNGVRGVR